MFRLDALRQEKPVVLIGCGGTGSFVAEGLCRLLPVEQELFFIDPDRIEPHNLRRQNFYQGDLGKFKSQALAECLSQRYRRKIAYSIQSISKEVMRNIAFGSLVIGCVDNATARRTIKSLRSKSWWLDAGNSENSGQVLIGNVSDAEELKGAFREELISRLPCPSLQQPTLLMASPAPAKLLDCAGAIEADEQSPVINQAMAVLVLEFVRQFFAGTLTWMGAYLDLKAGSLTTVPIEPKTVARMTGLSVKSLMQRRRE